MARRDDPFNNPFREVKSKLKQQVRDPLREAKGAEPIAVTPRPTPANRSGDEDALFQRAMSGVLPLGHTERVAPARSEVTPTSVRDEDAEVVAQLADLVAGSDAFDIADTTEYAEGVAGGVDRRLLKRLRRGDFSRQGHLDLHGMTRQEAREAVQQFISQSRVAGRRCVLIIHGRGLGSPDKVPVLKNALLGWLSQGRLGRQILAFSSARPVDGGAGALYVLLRK